MSDDSLRALERAVAEDPNDQLALERLQDERVRQGLGWHGEILPEADCGCRLRVARERAVYELPLSPRNAPAIVLELVFVPGGAEEKCPTCKPSSLHYLGREGRSCPTCGGANWLKIDPFYVGRFPVTRGQWKSFMCEGGAAGNHTMWMPRDGETDLHPVVNVSIEEVRSFAAWAGLRLPSQAEWRRAALGDQIPCDLCAGSGRLGQSVQQALGSPWSECLDCKGTGRVARRYPWGDDRPSPDRCVWAGHPEHGPYSREVHGGYGVDFAGSTAPVVDCAACVTGKCYSPLDHNGICHDGSSGLCKDPLVPARPLGASWCGAHDMAGNVWEWAEDGRRFGGSFRSDLSDGLPFRFTENGELQPADDVGFRVALSGASS